MSLRIGMIAPISHPYPPSGYGPWERVAHDLTEQLVAMGHDVTLFAAAGSASSARLIETVMAPLDSSGADPRLEEERHLSIAMEASRNGTFDVIHSHLHVHALVFSRLIGTPIVTTLHGVAWDPATHPLLLQYSEMPFVSLSQSERAFLPELNYVATVPNGIRTSEIPVGGGEGGYLVFVGRMAPEKAPDLAIETARSAGIPLHLAGIVEDRHRDFFETKVLAACSREVEYVGPLDRDDLWRLLGGARAMVMPLRWHEPFGLVAVESLASGTPVIAWRMGALPEVIEDGISGYLVDDVGEAVDSVELIDSLDRAVCRTTAEARFSDVVMAANYSEVYRRLSATTSVRGPDRQAPSPP
ncbi:MAG: glycosyltransferase family 4 protein [Acidimicrobiia bacterium]